MYMYMYMYMLHVVCIGMYEWKYKRSFSVTLFTLDTGVSTPVTTPDTTVSPPSMRPYSGRYNTVCIGIPR